VSESDSVASGLHCVKDSNSITNRISDWF